MSKRLQNCFTRVRDQKRCALVTFLTAGDPNRECSQRLFEQLAESSVDLLEIGMPFSDPVADGETIQLASKRALLQGTTLTSVLALAAEVRKKYLDLPIVLMGYANPVHRFGIEKFATQAEQSGIDGVILVDVPPEEDAPYLSALKKSNIALIRLVTPTSDDARLRTICHTDKCKGFIYVVSVAGTTGRKQALEGDLEQLAARLRKHSSLPLVAGFGVRSREQIAIFARYFDGVVVGSALIEEVASSHSCEDACARLQKTVAELQKGLGKNNQSS